MGFRGRTWKNLKVAFPGEARGPGREWAGPGAAGRGQEQQMEQPWCVCAGGEAAD